MFWFKLLLYVVVAIASHLLAGYGGYEARPLIDAWLNRHRIVPILPRSQTAPTHTPPPVFHDDGPPLLDDAVVSP